MRLYFHNLIFLLFLPVVVSATEGTPGDLSNGEGSDLRRVDGTPEESASSTPAADQLRNDCVELRTIEETDQIATKELQKHIGEIFEGMKKKNSLNLKAAHLLAKLRKNETNLSIKSANEEANKEASDYLQDLYKKFPGLDQIDVVDMNYKSSRFFIED